MTTVHVACRLEKDSIRFWTDYLSDTRGNFWFNLKFFHLILSS